MVSSNYGHIGVVKELAKRGAELNLATVRSILVKQLLHAR